MTPLPSEITHLAAPHGGMRLAPGRNMFPMSAAQFSKSKTDIWGGWEAPTAPPMGAELVYASLAQAGVKPGAAEKEINELFAHYADMRIDAGPSLQTLADHPELSGVERADLLAEARRENRRDTDAAKSYRGQMACEERAAAQARVDCEMGRNVLDGSKTARVEECMRLARDGRRQLTHAETEADGTVHTDGRSLTDTATGSVSAPGVTLGGSVGFQVNSSDASSRTTTHGDTTGRGEIKGYRQMCAESAHARHHYGQVIEEDEVQR